MDPKSELGVEFKDVLTKVGNNLVGNRNKLMQEMIDAGINPTTQQGSLLVGHFLNPLLDWGLATQNANNFANKLVGKLRGRGKQAFVTGHNNVVALLNQIPLLDEAKAEALLNKLSDPTLTQEEWLGELASAFRQPKRGKTWVDTFFNYEDAFKRGVGIR